MNTQCPKCQGTMEEGIINLAQGGGVSWKSKNEQTGLVSLLTTPMGGNLTGLKCQKCGYVEVYVK